MKHISFRFAAGLFVLAAGGAVAAEWQAPAQIRAFEIAEYRIADSFGAIDNPDDPRQAELIGRFRSPSGRTIEIPGFLHRDFEYAADAIVPTGKTEWRIRFTPPEPGEWTAGATLAIGGKAVEFGPSPLRVEANAQARGFLRRAKANPLALEWQNGDPLLAIGSNVFPSTRLGQPVGTERARDVIRYLEKTAAAGGNFCRMRMDSWFLPLECSPDEASGYLGAGRYSPLAAWEMDRIVEAAERVGIGLMLCISNTNAHVDSVETDAHRSAYNFYMKSKGGPLDRREDFWTDPEVYRLFEQKIRYCVARWGASPAIGIWEFFNEVKIDASNIDRVADWHARLARYWRAIDPYKRPIATSPVGGYVNEPHWWKLFSAPDIDLVQYHTYKYDDLAEGIGADNLSIVAQTDKPLIVGEFGTRKATRLAEFGSAGSDDRLDPEGWHIHNGLWASAMTGAAGAWPWFIRTHIDALNLYWRYTGLARFAADWRINQAPWKPVEVIVESAADYQPQSGEYADFNVPMLQKMARPESDVFAIGRDGSVDGGQINGYLFGIGGRKDMSRPPTFKVDFPVAGRFVVTVGTIVSKEDYANEIVVELDGREAARKAFPVGKGMGKSGEYVEAYGNWRVTYGEAIAIEMAPGPHEVRLSYTGSDRVDVAIRLENYLDPRFVAIYRAFAMAAGEEARLWIQHKQSDYASRFRGNGPASAPPARLRMPMSQPGQYEAEWWDTVKGEPVSRDSVECANGEIALEFPGTLSDMACKIMKTRIKTD